MRWSALVPTRQSRPPSVRTTRSAWTRRSPEHGVPCTRDGAASAPSPVRTTCSTWTRSVPEHRTTSGRTDAAIRAIVSRHCLLQTNSQLSRAQENIRSGRCGHPRHRQSAPPAPPEAHRPSREPGGIRRGAATQRRHHSDVQRAPRGTPRVEHRCRRARGHFSAEHRDGARPTHDRRCPGISISMCTERQGCLAPHRTRTLHMERVHQANSTGRQVAHPSGASMHREALQAFHVEQALGGGWAKALL